MATNKLNLNPNQFVSGEQSFSSLVTQVGNNNSLGNLHTISPGQKVTLPDGSTVTAQKGDTLSGLVDKWQTTTSTQKQPVPITNALSVEEKPVDKNPETSDENNTGAGKTEASTISVNGSSNSNELPPIRPNPLSTFSSSAYNISLYMINPDSFNLYAAGGETIPKDWKLICRSGGINNTSSTYDDVDATSTSPRADGFDLDFYIDDLKITTNVSSKETMGACNSFDFSFRIFEPYGFSFPTKLVKAATKIQQSSTIQRNVEESITALQTNFLLVIRFYGYDETGNLITSKNFPQAETNTSDPSAVFERSFPIVIHAFDFKLDPKMVVYNVKAKLISEQLGFEKTSLEIPEAMTVKGETVQDALQGSDDENKNQNAVGLMQRLNEIQQKLYDDEQITVKDVFKIKFEANAGIDTAFLVDIENSPIEKSPNANIKSSDSVNVKTESQPAVIQKRTRPISINKGDSILQAIDQIITQSSYVTQALKISNTEEYQKVKKTDDEHTENTPSTISWYNVVPNAKLLDFDTKRNVYATEITYIITRYEIPYIRGLQLGKRTQYYGPVKRYKHWFMSNDLEEKNSQHQKEIISYDVTYNLLYFNLAGYGSDAPNTDTDDKAPVANLSGGSNPTGKAPGWFDKAVGPLKTFLYSPADQLKAKIVILGDPDYLMTSTSKGYEEAITKWFGTDQSINPSSGQIFIEIAFRDAEDYAAPNAKAGAGLLNPTEDDKILFWKYPDSIKKKIQGVVYMVWQVVSTFNRGVFQQELKVCIPPFVSDEEEQKSTDKGETGREDQSSTEADSTYAVAPTQYNSTPGLKENKSDPSIATAVDSTGTGLKVNTNSIGSSTNLALPNKPNSTFGVANDDQTYAINTRSVVDSSEREA
jgi:hypothetical protein